MCSAQFPTSFLYRPHWKLDNVDLNSSPPHPSPPHLSQARSSLRSHSHLPLILQHLRPYVNFSKAVVGWPVCLSIIRSSLFIFKICFETIWMSLIKRNVLGKHKDGDFKTISTGSVKLYANKNDSYWICPLQFWQLSFWQLWWLGNYRWKICEFERKIR